MSSESSSTGATTASSTSRSPGWSLRMSISSRTSMAGVLQVAEPVLGLIQEEQADALATLEIVGHAAVVVEVDVGQIDARAGHQAERTLGGVGDVGERVDGRHLDRQLDAADTCEVGGEHQQVGRFRQR